MSDDATPATDAPGWAAIDAATQGRYPGQTPHQFTSQRAYDLDGDNPLPAVTVWASGAPRSWHYVGYGLSELFEKSSPIPDVSGFGIELTARVARGDEDQPPTWPVRLLQALGHYVLARKKGFDTGHCIDLGGPLDPEGAGEIRGLVCVPDPILRQIEAPFGRVLFLQLVGLTGDELAAFNDMKTEAIVGAMADLNPSGLTDLGRGSWMADPELRKIVLRYQVNIGL